MSNSSVEDLVNNYRKSHNLPLSSPITTTTTINEEAMDRREEDPYEVVGREFRTVTNKEYIEPLDKGVTFTFPELQAILEQTTLDINKPLLSYEHDPIHLVKALMIATNIEHCARSAASTIPYKNLQILEGNDTTKIVDSIRDSKEQKQQVQETTEEFIYALKAVQAASINIPLPTNTKNTNTNTNK